MLPQKLLLQLQAHPIQSLLNPAQLPSGVHHALWQGASLSFPVPRVHACSCFTLSVAAAEVPWHQPFTACWSPLCVPTTSVPLKHAQCHMSGMGMLYLESCSPLLLPVTLCSHASLLTEQHSPCLMHSKFGELQWYLQVLTSFVTATSLRN